MLLVNLWFIVNKLFLLGLTVFYFHASRFEPPGGDSRREAASFLQIFLQTSWATEPLYVCWCDSFHLWIQEFKHQRSCTVLTAFTSSGVDNWRCWNSFQGSTDRNLNIVLLLVSFAWPHKSNLCEKLFWNAVRSTLYGINAKVWKDAGKGYNMQVIAQGHDSHERSHILCDSYLSVKCINTTYTAYKCGKNNRNPTWLFKCFYSIAISWHLCVFNKCVYVWNSSVIFLCFLSKPFLLLHNTFFSDLTINAWIVHRNVSPCVTCTVIGGLTCQSKKRGGAWALT